jgi:hypothetical protein
MIWAAVEVRADRGELLLLGEPGDPHLEVVVGAREAAALRGCGSCSRPGSACAAAEQRPGVADVAAHGRVGPLAVAVAVEAQVQLDEPAPTSSVTSLEKRSACIRLRVSLAPTTSWWWKLTPPPPRTAGCAACRRRASARRSAARSRGRARPVRPGLQRDRLLEHGQRVLVHVLVPVVLVDLELQRGQLGQHGSASPVSTSSRSPARGPAPQSSLTSSLLDPLGRHDVDPLGHLGHRGDHLGRDVEPELDGEPGGPHHPQRVVAERLLRRARACAARPRAGRPGRRTGRRTRPGSRTAIALTVKSRRTQVALERVAVRHLGLARLRS